MTNTDRTEILNVKAATLYLQGGLGSYERTECRNVRVEVGPYAQHSRSYFVFFTPKGARRERGLVLSSISRKGFVLAGHGQPEIRDAWGPAAAGSTPGVTVQRSRHMSCDPAWDAEAAAALAGVAPLLDIAADVAAHGGVS